MQLFLTNSTKSIVQQQKKGRGGITEDVGSISGDCSRVIVPIARASDDRTRCMPNSPAGSAPTDLLVGGVDGWAREDCV